MNTTTLSIDYDNNDTVDYDNNDTVDYDTSQEPQTQDETAFGGRDTKEIEIAIRSVERHFGITLNREQANNFYLDSDGRLLYKKVYITQKNGEFFSLKIEP